MRLLKEAGNISEISLKGHTAIVTGGDSNIGEAICYLLAQNGVNVVVAARNEEKMQQVLTKINGMKNDGMIAPTDVTNYRSIEKTVSSVVEKYSRVDILVNSAGVTGPVETPLQEIKETDWDVVMNVNAKGTFLVCKAVLPFMISQKYGRIVNIAGTSGLRGYINRAAYSSSKWAVRGLTRTLALEVGKYNINVNAICPGVVEGRRMSDIIAKKARAWNHPEQEVYQKYLDEMALRRFTLPEDVARVALFLVSEGGRQITGHEIAVDGGWDV